MTPAADVYRGADLVAHFYREGNELLLAPIAPLDFLSVHLRGNDLPYRGVHLPSYFLNLLPEGARLRLLLDSARAKDDELGLLIRTGWDTIGDVSVLPHGEPQQQLATRHRLPNLAQVDFWELFHESVGRSSDSAIPGAQEKISDATVAFPLERRNAPSAILKLQPPSFPNLVANEHFFMSLARSCGLEAARTQVVVDQKGNPGLFVRRFDRVAGQKLHQEDACQLLDIPPSRKYTVTLRDVADRVADLSGAPPVELRRLLLLYAFSYFIGNGDLHAKNISLLWRDVVGLSPAYDVLSTLPYPLDRHMAIPMDGRDRNFRPAHFVEFGRRYGVAKAVLRRDLTQMAERIGRALVRLSEIGFDAKTTQNMTHEISSRLERFTAPGV